MKHQNARRSVLMGVLLITALALVGCSSSTPAAAVEKPATVEEIPGSELSRLVLTEHAAQRLGIAMAAVQTETVDGSARLTVRYSAVIHDPNGQSWVYASPEPLVFVREPLEVEYVKDGLAVLRTGPAPGTNVAAVGAAELFGLEFGIGK